MDADDDRALDEEEGQAQAPGDVPGEMVKDEPGTRKEATAPEKEQPPRKQPTEERVTAPQSPYGTREVGIGFAVLVVGLIIAFLLPVAML